MYQNQRIEHEIEPDEKPSTVIVRGVAALTDARIDELEPIGRVIDAEAMDSILRNDSASIRFKYDDFEISAESDSVVIERQNPD